MLVRLSRAHGIHPAICLCAWLALAGVQDGGLQFAVHKSSPKDVSPLSSNDHFGSTGGASGTACAWLSSGKNCMQWFQVPPVPPPARQSCLPPLALPFRVSLCCIDGRPP